MIKKSLFSKLLACVVAGLAVQAVPAMADDYPSKSIRLIVPFPPGGVSDIIAREIGAHLSTSWSQPVIVDNRPGAGGNIGMQLGAKSPPDGYTIVLGSTSTLAVSPSLYKNLNFDARKDFTAVALAAFIENVLVVNNTVPASNFSQFVGYLKANPGKVYFASPSSGNTSHLSGEMFKRRAGVDIVHVPYKGDMPALTDLIGGRVQMMFATITTALPHIQSGKLTPLVIAGPSRSARLPNVPSIAEVGIDNFNTEAWFSFVAPKDTPPAIVNKLNQGINAALATPKVKNALTSIGFRVSPMSVAAFAEFLPREAEKWGQLVRESGASVD